MAKSPLSFYKEQLEHLQCLATKNERWLIIISADPDAIASSLALKRIIARRAEEVSIARINEIKRPDNLSMLGYLRVKIPMLTPEMLSKYQRFAMVDSQPGHHAETKDISFSVVIDHHPYTKIENSSADALIDVRPNYGACSTILMGYLKAANIRPGKMLATAMLYGVRTDTGNFSHKTTLADLRAFRTLSRLADQAKLSRIVRSEFFLPWIKPFGNALDHIVSIGTGKFIFFENAPSSDLLVLTVDFLMRVHEVRWAAVAGVENDNLVVTLRSDGVRNVGKLAERAFGEYGMAGGHQNMARAEIPLKKIPSQNLAKFTATCIRHALGKKKNPTVSTAPTGSTASTESAE